MCQFCTLKVGATFVVVCCFSQKFEAPEDRAVAKATYRLVDKRVARVAAVKGVGVAAAAAAVQRHAAGHVDLAGGLWVLLGHLHAHLSGLARGPLHLLQDDWEKGTGRCLLRKRESFRLRRCLSAQLAGNQPPFIYNFLLRLRHVGHLLCTYLAANPNSFMLNEELKPF